MVFFELMLNKYKYPLTFIIVSCLLSISLYYITKIYTPEKTISIQEANINQLPIGYLDSIKNGVITGWVFDPNLPSNNIKLEIIVESRFERKKINVNTSFVRPDVNSSFNITGQHGFVSQALQTNTTNVTRVYVYAIDANDATQKVQIAASPRTFVPDNLPQFVSSDQFFSDMLNDMFHLHYSYTTGPSSKRGNQQTSQREWDIISNIWFNTSTYKAYSDFKNVLGENGEMSICGVNIPLVNCTQVDDVYDQHQGIKDNLEKIIVDNEGYVWMYQSFCGDNKGYRGWPFPLDKKDANYPCANNPALYPAGAKTYDSRYITTNTAFISANVEYFLWTKDIGFLNRNIPRVRRATEFLISQQESETKALIQTKWEGHNAVAGTVGSGIGLDLLPYGNRDANATINYYHSLKKLEELEKSIKSHPEWGVPLPSNSNLFAQSLNIRASKIKDYASKYFWINPDTGQTSTDYSYGRFYASEDTNGVKHDYGFLQLNLEAVVNDFANEEQKKTIVNWLDGKIIYPNDNSKGGDIYKFLLAPRFTTKNNPNWYVWAWICIDNDCDNRKVSRTWEDNIQNGGMFMLSSYFDVMARIKTFGANNAYGRLKIFLQKYSDTQNIGGYRKYFKNAGVDVQGCLPNGLVGMDCEFTDSILSPLSALYGFVGIDVIAEGLSIKPNLPNELNDLAVKNVYYQGTYFDIFINNKNTAATYLGQNKLLINVNKSDQILIPIDFKISPTDSAKAIFKGNNIQMVINGIPYTIFLLDQ